ncbi:bifunctional DNA-formamidopyrimidine glycosylase/DNA-(apurinic or apyrimidinic site) lyase [Litorimonas sp. RW-G-Af-16]|uniref:bifunctional DNA-formamidopyrimidine glycosylase/DNA-(apurinic or apyrimidinic site) lyase n=1 Tax=Litorimonas sp. RW-G-Af-16 TaxID=3241168 RepID=UPI00390C439D
MPELPEVETVMRGLSPVMEGFVFEGVTLNRPDLRFPFGDDFVARVQGQTLSKLSRRAKFLQAELSSGERLFMHLGMSGRFTIDAAPTADFVHTHNTNPKHDHVVFQMSSGARVTFNDPRRFGFMELVAANAPYRLDDLGPEPLSNQFNAPDLRQRLKGKKSKIKAALLDQHVVAGLGNIYVCEALFRTGITPRRGAGRLTVTETETLVRHIKDVITEAIAAGGSSLRDFANTDGDLGYFQHTFSVYGREGQPCQTCNAPITRIVQSGRSSFYCRACQK